MNDPKRDMQLTGWIEAALEHEAVKYDAELMWGVWLSTDDETCPPDALFPSEQKARAYVELLDSRESDVAPCIVKTRTRNNFDVPKIDGERASTS